MTDAGNASGAKAFAVALAALSPDLLAGPAAPDGVRIRADLLPASAWGSNLRGILSAQEWERLRLPIIDAAGGCCEICRARPASRRPDCHEQWAFELRAIAPDEMPLPVQRLVRLVALCPGCHSVQHIGLASLRGYLDEARARLAQLNSWSAVEVAADLHRANQRFALLEVVPWDLDLQILAGQIEVKGFPDLYIPSSAREYLGHARRGQR
jgi:hypothetical protein